MTDIVIVSYDDSFELGRCVTCIKEFCTDYNLIIIDNNETNIGYTAGVNKGIKQGTGEYIWLLNSDCYITEGAQEGLIAMLNRFPRAGIAGSMQIDPEDLAKDRIMHGGTTQAWPHGVHKGGSVSKGHCGVPERQTWVNGASMMLKREMVNVIGPLDESMFLLYSDSDYCFWARERGWDVWYTPDSKVLHKLKASAGPNEWAIKDRAAFMKKWGIREVNPNQYTYSEKFARLHNFP
jgi:hypothetical protein